MRWLPDLRWQRGVIWLLIFVTAAALGAVAFVASGAFNVAANSRHFTLTEDIISFALDRSIALRGGARKAPNLDEPGLVRLGALHFENGCAACHGRPGDPASPIAQNMYPSPPSLHRAAEEWTDSELAYIVYSGLKMTGMPAWAGMDRDDEVWPLVAYIKALPDIDASEYAALVDPAGAADAILAIGNVATNVAHCESCHGSATSRPVVPDVPSLTNQSPQYLQRSLEAYRGNLRQSGLMEPIAAEMTDSDVRMFALHFGSEVPPAWPPPPAQDEMSAGARLFWRGVPSDGIPACSHCHNRNAGPAFPRLNELSERYVGVQLQLFRSGVRANTPQSKIMAKIAERLSDQDVKAVAEYIGGMGGGARQVDAVPEATR